MLKYLIASFLFLFTSQLSAQMPDITKYKYQDSNDSCLSTLEYYSHYWKMDSLGKNGFRDLFGQFILKDCDCKGKRWDIVYKFLGKPNLKFRLSDKKGFRYRYRLNNYSKDLTDIGTILLDIDVQENGIIARFAIWGVDG